MTREVYFFLAEISALGNARSNSIGSGHPRRPDCAGTPS